jgi:hypothetical protein
MISALSGYIPSVSLLRGLAGALLWIVSALLAIVAVILCVTVILLPVGLPLLGYARRLFTLSLKLVLPRAVSHPVETAEKSMQTGGRKAKKELPVTAPDLKKVHEWGRDTGRRIRKRAPLVS